MASQEMLNALEKAIVETGEQLFFQELREARVQNPGEQIVQGDFMVSVNIEEPFKGTLYLVYEHQFAPQLVTEMVGQVVNQEAQIIDGLNELSNTITGKFMANYVPNRPFKIGLPQCTKVFKAQDVPFGQIFYFYFDETRIGAYLQAE